ncbi:hypothetical protein [Brevundimonas sp.]|uniref:hypothetical protein n=1 Tax=Brevundimonas sp. TaxID=1871086 RepID=UPI00289C5D8A|nr:hypothetical protein [Brevundimonas sp.]
MKTALILVTALAYAIPGAAPAQAKDATQEAAADWDMARDPERKLTLAHTVFDNGLGIGARCMNGSFQVLISGLPPATDATRQLRIAFGDDDFDDQRWNVAENPEVAISDRPSPLARDMREGGKMQIIVAGGAEGGRNLRYVMDLPASSAAIDETLQACDRPLVDPRDAELDALGDDGLPMNIEWAQQPEPIYPQGRTYTRGFATVTCLTQPDGRVRDCVVETEHPINGGFGRAALDATRRARLKSKDGGEVPLGMIQFRTNFMMDSTPSTGSRLRSN